MSSKHRLKPFSLIHDSYSVHACDVDVLHKVLREEFRDIYSVNQLEFLKDLFNNQLMMHDTKTKIEVDTAALMGEYDIEEVLEAEYFFS